MDKNIVLVDNSNKLRALGLIDLYLIENFRIYNQEVINKILKEKEKTGKYSISIRFQTENRESAFFIFEHFINRTFHSERNEKDIKNNALYCIKNAIQEELSSTMDKKKNITLKESLSKDTRELSKKIKALNKLMADVNFDNITISETSKRELYDPINYPFLCPLDRTLIENKKHIYRSYFNREGVGIKKYDILNVKVLYNEMWGLYLSIEALETINKDKVFFSYVYKKKEGCFDFESNNIEEKMHYNVISFEKEYLEKKTNEYLTLIKSVMLENVKSL